MRKTRNKLMSTFGAVGPLHSPWPELPNRTCVTGSVGAHVEVLRVGAGVTENLDRPVLDLVGELRGRSRRVQHVGVGRHRDERARGSAEERVQLPPASDVPQHAAVVQPASAAAERQLVNQRRIQPVRSARLSLVQIEVLGNRDGRPPPVRSFWRTCTPR